MRHYIKYTAHMLKVIATCLALALLANPIQANLPVPESAQAVGALDNNGQHHAQAQLIFDVAQAAPEQAFYAGVLVTLDNGWHTYWKNPGESALPSVLKWYGPAVTFGDLLWPAPSAFAEFEGEVLTFGYSKQVLLLAPVYVSATTAKQISIGVTLKLLVCRDICVPFAATLQRDLSLAKTPVPSAQADLFKQSLAQVPRPIAHTGMRIAAELTQVPSQGKAPFAATLWLDTCTGQGVSDCHKISFASDQRQIFFHHQVTGLDMRLTAVEPVANTGGYKFNLVGQSRRIFDANSITSWGGVIRYINSNGQAQAVEFTLPFTFEPTALRWSEAPADPALATAAAAQASEQPTIALWQILLFALLGGLILNVMPCVFPVLAIKAAALTDLAREHNSPLLGHALTYTGGIVTSLWALAGLVVSLKAAGNAVGWGFQFQSPGFVAALTAIVVLFALNMFGLYQIGLPAQGLSQHMQNLRGLARSFSEGVLAVVLATPCSAPFLGSALGFAFAAPAHITFAVMTFVGLGLALPFVLLTLLPRLRHFLPQPGHWMDRLKIALGILLLATAVWLLNLLGSLAGTSAIIRMLMFLLVLSISAWIYGAVQYRSGPRKWAPIAVALALVAWASRPLFALAPERSTLSLSSNKPLGQAYSKAAVQAALAQGKNVFVDFTADWCLTCKFNEHTVLRSQRVQQLFEQHNVVLFVADWTHQDETIRATLERYGRAGVPMYLLYKPGLAQPLLLPELLTVGALENALN